MDILYIVVAVPETRLLMFEPQTVRIMVAKKTFLTFCYDMIQLVQTFLIFTWRFTWMAVACLPKTNRVKETMLPTTARQKLLSTLYKLE